MAVFPMVPLYSVTSVNKESLPDQTPPDNPVSYIDISDVELGRFLFSGREMTFAEAPSRARRKASEGDILVSTVRTYLKAITPVDSTHSSCVFSTGFAVISPLQSAVISRYLNHVLVSSRFIDEVITHSNGVSYPAINTSDLMQIRIPLPDLDTQRRIADYLDKETAQIDKLTAELDGYVELLEKRKQLVIDHYAAPRDVPRAAIGIDAELVTSGSRGWGQYYADSGERFLRITDIQRNSIEISDKSVQYVHLPANSEGTRTLTKVGDILVSITADLGSVGLVNTEHVGCYTSQHVALVRLIGNKFHSDFAAWALKTSEVQRFFTQEGSGGTKQGLTLDEIKQARIPLPPLDKQEEIAQIITEEFAQTDSIITQCRELKELLLKRRQVLITDVVTGKVEV